MTPEERAKLKGDTIIWPQIKNRNLKDNYADLLAQRMQDGLRNANRPLKPNVLDSLFNKTLTDHNLQAISYIEIPNMQKNIDALETAVKFIYDNIQYAEFNTKSDYCHVCGYDGEIIINDNLEWECPNCGNKDHDKMNVTRRTCGYLGENFWNVGKTKEINARVLHL